MSFEVCGMIVECVNLGVSVYIWKDVLFLPCVSTWHGSLCWGQLWIFSWYSKELWLWAQIFSFSKQIVEFCCSFVAESWCPATPDEKVGWGIWSSCCPFLLIRGHTLAQYCHGVKFGQFSKWKKLGFFYYVFLCNIVLFDVIPEMQPPFLSGCWE